MQNFELPSELFAAIIGVGISFVIGATGFVIAAFNDHRKWRRDERLKAYIEITRLHRKYYQKFLEISAVTDFHTGKYRALLFEAIALLEEIEVFWGSLEILGSKRFEKAMNAYVTFVNDTISQLSPDGHQIDATKFRADHKAHWKPVVKAAKRDLSLRN